MSENAIQRDTVESPAVSAGDPELRRQQIEEARGEIRFELLRLNADRMELVDKHKYALEQVHAWEKVAARLAGDIGKLDERREELVALDDAAGEHLRLIERLIVRRQPK